MGPFWSTSFLESTRYILILVGGRHPFLPEISKFRYISIFYNNLSLIHIFLFLRPSTAQKMKFSIKDFFQQMWPNPQLPADFVTFTEEILIGKLHFLCSVLCTFQGEFHQKNQIKFLRLAKAYFKYDVRISSFNFH